MPKDILTINKALNDLKDYYGLKDIKHVTLNMDDPNDVYITFMSNKPNSDLIDTHDKHTIPSDVKYKLSLSIIVSQEWIDECFKDRRDEEWNI